MSSLLLKPPDSSPLPIDSIPYNADTGSQPREGPAAGVLFEPYAVENGKLLFRGSECLEQEPMIECHFFSRDREYRLVMREARGDCIERILTAEEERSMDPDLLYAQEMLVKEEYARRGGLPEKLLVMNRYAFTENDTLALKDYRISCP